MLCYLQDIHNWRMYTERYAKYIKKSKKHILYISVIYIRPDGSPYPESNRIAVP